MLGAIRAAERAVLVRHDLELFGMVDGRYRLLSVGKIVVEHHAIEIVDLTVRHLDRWQLLGCRRYPAKARMRASDIFVHRVGVENHPVRQVAVGRLLIEQRQDMLAVRVALDCGGRCELVGERDVAGDAQVAISRKAFLHVSKRDRLPEVVAPAAERASGEPAVDALYRDVVKEDVASVAVKRQEQQIQIGKFRHSRQRVGNHGTPLYSACFSLCEHQRELGAHRSPMLSNRDLCKATSRDGNGGTSHNQPRRAAGQALAARFPYADR